jgi:hypothetical protein
MLFQGHIFKEFLIIFGITQEYPNSTILVRTLPVPVP